jgi:hypothetical protein
MKQINPEHKSAVSPLNQLSKSKSKAVPLHAMEALGGEEV